MNIPEPIKTAAANVIVIGGMLALTAWMQARDDAPAQIAECTPADEGEIAIQTIEQGVITCEKHPRLGYAMAQTPTLACPIKGACESSNLIARN